MPWPPEAPRAKTGLITAGREGKKWKEGPSLVPGQIFLGWMKSRP